MHKLADAVGVGPRQLAEKICEWIVGVASETVVPLQLHPRPFDCPLCPNVKPVGVKQGPLVVVPQEHHFAAISDDARALTRIRTVAHHVAEAEDFFNALLLDILEHGLESLEVAVDVANDGPLHALLQPWGKFARVS